MTLDGGCKIGEDLEDGRDDVLDTVGVVLNVAIEFDKAALQEHL
jgi:hypothetical protein